MKSPGPRTNRLEAFSDGVLAIIVTIMVFDVKLPALGPQPGPAELSSAFAALAPKFFSFIIYVVVLIAFLLPERQWMDNDGKTE